MSGIAEEKQTSADASSTASPTEKAPGGASTLRLDLMIDLETLGTKKDSLILSVGIVLFDPDAAPGTLLDSFHFPMDLAAQKGGQLELSCITDFWFQQPDAAKAMTDLRAAVPHRQPEHLASLLENLIKRYPNAKVWGNAPSFDCDIIDSLLTRCGLGGKPWKFYNERDYRTLKAEFGHLVKLPKAEVAHDALSDAKAQAIGVQTIMRALRHGGQE